MIRLTRPVGGTATYTDALSQSDTRDPKLYRMSLAGHISFVFTCSHVLVHMLINIFPSQSCLCISSMCLNLSSIVDATACTQLSFHAPFIPIQTKLPICSAPRRKEIHVKISKHPALLACHCNNRTTHEMIGNSCHFMHKMKTRKPQIVSFSPRK
jgi:hypothetical protein